MENRKRIFIIIGLIVVGLIIAALIWWLVARQMGGPAATNINGPVDFSQQLPVTRPIIVEPGSEPVVENPDVAASLRAVARTFAERYGSFSNQSNFSNLEDAQSLMTASFQQRAIGLLQGQLPAAAADSYYGITTIALSAQITSYDPAAGQATVEVSTQRREAKGTTANPRTLYQQLIIQLVESGGSWLVDGATWQ